ncbi:MAG: glycosyltransferase family 4 protein [Synergistaceae bacterium]|nr:glycosyltransferase family 4 protein [Synergistaceae bacterium]
MLKTDNRQQTTDNRQQTTDSRHTFCIISNIANVHLTKELGPLALGMMTYHGYDSFIATYENGDYLNLKYLPGVRMEFIPRISKNWIIDACIWIAKNARRIDLFNIFHPIFKSFLFAFIYKLLNPKGKIYLKFDGAYRNTGRGSFWKRSLYRWLVKHSDCVSTELEGNDKLLSEDWGRKIICVPNPILQNEIQPFRPFSERSNTIFYAGRTEREKGTRTLLEAFAKIAGQIPEWTLKLAGRITEQDIVDDFHAVHPELRERVIFTGEIRDRQTLMDMYRDAKIFAFPSRWESFGIALTEAMMQGCFAVATDIPSTRTLTENFRYALGSPVDDVDGLAKNLLYACTHESEIEALAREGRDATLKRCDLKRICEVIAEGVM